MYHSILIFTMILIDCDSKNYCSEDVCNNSKQHTLCKYQSNQPASNCLNYNRLIQENDKLIILNKINERRNKIAAGEIRSLPTAENMMALVWNDELAKSAQRWADQCVQHSSPDVKDTCRDIVKLSVGQNIATVYGDAPGLSHLALVDVWYTELLNVNETIIAKYRPSIEVTSAHYDYFTQLIWADSSDVGCGAVKFKQGSGAQKNKTVHRLVCNFAPAGNRIGESVYADGLPCSRCPGRGVCDVNFTALCRSSIKSLYLSPVDVRSDDYLVADAEDISLSNQTIKVTPTDELNQSEVTDDILTIFDYFSHTNNLSRQQVTGTSTTISSCKEILAVDDLLELLKKKISSDPLFKDIISLKREMDHTDSSLSDPGMASFVNRLYSKKGTPTTTSPPLSENLNSTLLTELVEAVIFRNSDTNKRPATEYVERLTGDIIGISPVKIQAELPQIRSNDDFTGHYFFPEDETEENNMNSETNEFDYEANTNIPLSDVISELQDLKRQLETKDFVDEILESESTLDTIPTTKFILPDSIGIYNSGHNNMKKFLEEISEKNDKLVIMKDYASSEEKGSVGNEKSLIRKRSEQFIPVQESYEVNYDNSHFDDSVAKVMAKKPRKARKKHHKNGSINEMQHSEMLKKLMTYFSVKSDEDLNSSITSTLKPAGFLIYWIFYVVVHYIY